MGLTHAQTYRWTVSEFERLDELGMLPAHGRVELIEGEIVTMPPMNTPHGNAMMQGNNHLVHQFGDTHMVRVQLPFNIPDYSQPEPDFALVPKASVNKSCHPSAADLIIEVADTSLSFDRDEKASLYARAGVPDYWIVNLQDELLEVYRNPGPDRSARYGFSYHAINRVPMNEAMAPLFAPQRPVPVTVFF